MLAHGRWKTTQGQIRKNNRSQRKRGRAGRGITAGAEVATYFSPPLPAGSALLAAFSPAATSLRWIASNTSRR